ncbi:MAG: DUF3276 family protein [Bacteroidia bacterium]
MQDDKNWNREEKRKTNDKQDIVFSKRVKAGKRTYFFDVRANLSNDYYVTITESKRKHDNIFVRHKLYLYKEDFNKFAEGLEEVVSYIKEELLPEFDYEKFDNRDEDDPGYPDSDIEQDEYPDDQVK